MEITIFVDGDGQFVVGEFEGGFGFICGGKRASMAAFIGFDEDPLNIMFIGHGVFDATDFDAEPRAAVIAFDGDDGEMFFVAGVNGIGVEFFHGFAAAMWVDTGIEDHTDLVTAVFTDVEF